MPVISTKNLSIKLKSQTLVKGVNISIEKGEIHGLIGESGSGKSLTALSMAALLPNGIEVSEGDITLMDGKGETVINKASEKELQSIRGNRIGFIFQDPMTALNPSMRCGKQVVENLKQHGLFKGKAKEEVIRLFEKVKLPTPEKIFSSYPHEISGGQRQRVMIAMAVACKPSLLIADEITTALDITVQKSIIDLIDELRKSEGLAVLFITHDLGLIAAIADNLSIMYQGEIVESGNAVEIAKSPKHSYTKGLLACKPPLDKKVDRLITVEEVMNGSAQDQKTISSVNQSNEVLLEVNNLNAYYVLKRNFLGKVSSEMHALNQISFQLFRNESMALVGESGSGKSTLGRTLLGLIEARNGEVRYKGKSLLHLSRKEFQHFRKNIQFIFQDPYASLNPKQSVGESIMEPLKVHDIGKDKEERKKMVIDLLVKVGLSETDFQKYPHQFSGGQRQRIVIARALSVNPEFIVCDEAVSALDVSVQATILNLLKDLQKEYQLTYLFITHDMSVVRFFCDRMLVMKLGEIIESGTSEEIFENPKHPFTRELIGASY